MTTNLLVHGHILIKSDVMFILVIYGGSKCDKKLLYDDQQDPSCSRDFTPKNVSRKLSSLVLSSCSVKGALKR